MNFKEGKYIFILAVIIFIALFLRLYQLGQNPPSLTWDEAAWGYNAYSLGIDGRDEFGRFLPLDYLESFGDFKPPLYAYASIIPVKIFGMTEFAVRFASAFFGLLAVLVTYFLVKRIFGSRESLALFSAFILAISPWHINLSRVAFEANVASFFIVLGVWLFLVGIQEKKWYLLLSAVAFILSMYTFNTARIVTPILVFVLTFGFRRQLLERKKQVLISILLGVVIFAPLSRFILTPQASLRFKEVNIFWDIDLLERTNREIENDGAVWWSKIIHNRRLAFGVEYIKHYFDHFSPSFLFIKGDSNPKFSTQDVGQLYLWELPFFIAGFLFLFRQRIGYWWIVPLWMMIGIIPAATARETPHALRIETTLPTFQIITAYGAFVFINTISNIKYFKFLIAVFIFPLLFFNFVYYIHGYYVHYPHEYSGEWQYGYKESIEYVNGVQDEYDQIRITNAMGRPYIYYAFFTKTDPKAFRKTAIVKRDSFGFVKVSGFLKYRFSDNLSTIGGNARKILYIDLPGKVHPKGYILKRFYLLNGEPALTAYRFI